MDEKITVHGNPEKSVFGLIGADILTDEDKFYVKVANDSKNTGWKEIPPTPTPTPTISVTPTKTPIVTRQILTSPTPTPTKTPTQTPSISASSPLITPTPSNTPFKTQVQYSIESTAGGTANRVDGPNTGTVTIGSGTMQLQATPDEGSTFNGWSAPEGVIFSDIYSLNPIASGFNVNDNFTITANFSSTPSLPGYIVYGVADSNGNFGYYYIDTAGQSGYSFQSGFSPSQIIPNAGCVNQIVSAGPGYAELTSQGC